MAQRITTLLIDDIDGGEAAETVSFSLDGHGYEIDLSGEHAAALRELMGPFTRAARLVVSSTPRQVRLQQRQQQRRQPARVDPEQRRAMREWALQNGYDVSVRGRLPGPVIQAWETAHA